MDSSIIRKRADKVNCMLPLPNSRLVVSCKDRHVIYVYNILTGEQKPLQVQHVHGVTCLATINGRSLKITLIYSKKISLS